jgi:hypothetical protein
MKIYSDGVKTVACPHGCGVEHECAAALSTKERAQRAASKRWQGHRVIGRKKPRKRPTDLIDPDKDCRDAEAKADGSKVY